MSVLPQNPKIYHLTHVENLLQMVDGVLWSDAERIRRELDCRVIGMDKIKQRRLEELDVDCHPGTRVGEYVPFYFCSRSVMLYLLYQGNHPNLTYRGGQRPIVHLEADLHAAVVWSKANGKRWAFSSGNSGTRYTPFFGEIERLDALDWNAIAATEWKDPFVKEGKQAEFLVEQSFPWELIERVGVNDKEMAQAGGVALSEARHKPPIVVLRHWYY